MKTYTVSKQHEDIIEILKGVAHTKDTNTVVEKAIMGYARTADLIFEATKHDMVVRTVTIDEKVYIKILKILEGGQVDLSDLIGKLLAMWAED